LADGFSKGLRSGRIDFRPIAHTPNYQQQYHKEEYGAIKPDHPIQPSAAVNVKVCESGSSCKPES
jgi:hypothetical protein